MDESLLDKENRRKRKQQRREEREKQAEEEKINDEEPKKKESQMQPILLNNQKDFTHDRSLSKVRDVFAGGEKEPQQTQHSIFSEKFQESQKAVEKPAETKTVEEPRPRF